MSRHERPRRGGEGKSASGAIQHDCCESWVLLLVVVVVVVVVVLPPTLRHLSHDPHLAVGASEGRSEGRSCTQKDVVVCPPPSCASSLPWKSVHLPPTRPVGPAGQHGQGRQHADK